MADNLRRAIQDLTLGIEDEPVALSIDDCAEARRATQFSLMGRPTILRKQNLRAMMTSLPKMWGLSGVISGRIVEKKKFQFVFPSEELLQSVLSRGPWAYNERMLIINRWNPALGDAQLNHIPFWVQIRGIPLEFLTATMIRNIGDRIGEVLLVDFKPEITGDVEFVRVQFNWDVSKPLRFQRNFQFYPGINTLLKFRYERLRGFCEDCGMLTHDTGECIPVVADVQPGNDGDDDQGDDDEDMPDERSSNIQQPDNTGMAEADMSEDQPALENHPGFNTHGSNMALLKHFWSQAPMDVDWEEHYRRSETERSLRKRKFVDNLVEAQSPDLLSMVKGKAVVESENEDDHVIQEMEERRDSEFRQDEIPNSVESYKYMEGSSSVKRFRSDGDIVDKYPIGRLKVSAECNGLSKLQVDYDDDQEQENGDPIDRGAVGPVPPKMVLVSPQGLGGGLAVLWKNYVSVSCISSDVRLVDLYVEYKAFKFYLSCVYGNPIPKYRHHLWERIQRIAVSRVGPWMICGDCNEITDPSEKRGGRLRTLNSSKDFNNMLQVCDMKDLKFKGNPFSWVGRRRNEVIECCLDRVLVNTEWLNQYPNSETEYLEIAESDHRPMIITIDYQQKRKKGWFCYDKRLYEQESFVDTVTEAWNETGGLEGWMRKLDHCRALWGITHPRNRLKIVEGKGAQESKLVFGYWYRGGEMMQEAITSEIHGGGALKRRCLQLFACWTRVR
ncbi:hypothetical protein Bca4012_057503 [Brassica carinata]